MLLHHPRLIKPSFNKPVYNLGIFFAIYIVKSSSMNYILSLILLVSSIYAKTADFSIIIDEPFNNSLVDITEDYDREISAVGIIKTNNINQPHKSNSYTNAFEYLSSLSNMHGSKIELVKINNQADITLRKSIKLSNFSEAVGILKTPQNGYFIGGYTLDGSSLVLKLDSNGETLFKKIFATSGLEKMSKIVLMRDGGVLAVGFSLTSKSSSYDVFGSGLGLNDIYLTRFSSSGTVMWSKKYGTVYDDAGVDAVEANDGSIMVLGQTNSQNIKNIIIMRITKDGDKIWLKEYESEKRITAHKIIKLRDGGFAISLSQEDEIGKEQIKILKIDLHNNILIDRLINTNYATVLNDIQEYSDGKIIGVGYVQDNYDTDGVAMLLDSKFSMLTQEHYGFEEYDTFNALSILHNSQVAVAGSYTNRDSQESNMWIVKLNRDLSMAQSSTKSTDFFTELNMIFKDEIEKNQIAIKEDLSINFVQNSLYFDVEEYKLTKHQKEFLKNFSKKLLPFLSKNQELVNTLEINGHTSSEWGTDNFSNRYLKNAKLSINRSYSTLSYMFSNQDESTQKWLSQILKGSGLSFSKKVMFEKNEDKEKSRRVSFKIILSKK